MNSNSMYVFSSSSLGVFTFQVQVRVRFGQKNEFFEFDSESAALTGTIKFKQII